MLQSVAQPTVVVRVLPQERERKDAAEQQEDRMRRRKEAHSTETGYP